MPQDSKRGAYQSVSQRPGLPSSGGNNRFYPPRDIGRCLYDDFSGAAPETWWTTALGTIATNGGALRASAIASDGYNYVTTNPEFTTNTDDWTPNVPATLTRRDYTAAPNIAPTGGDDEFGMEISTAGGGIGATGLYAITAMVPGCNCTATCRAYSPSANTAVNAANLTTGDAVFSPTTVEDTWETLTRTVTVDGSFDGICLSNQSATGGDLAHYDRAWAVMNSAIAYVNAYVPDRQIIANVVSPAVLATPRALVLRYQDVNNYVRLLILPNTAGTDTYLETVTAGVRATIQSADIDWTPGGTDALRVTVRGNLYTVEHMKSGATAYTKAFDTGCSSFSDSRNFGVQLFAAADNSFADWRMTTP